MLMSFSKLLAGHSKKQDAGLAGVLRYSSFVWTASLVTSLPDHREQLGGAESPEIPFSFVEQLQVLCLSRSRSWNWS